MKTTDIFGNLATLSASIGKLAIPDYPSMFQGLESMIPTVEPLMTPDYSAILKKLEMVYPSIGVLNIPNYSSIIKSLETMSPAINIMNMRDYSLALKSLDIIHSSVSTLNYQNSSEMFDSIASISELIKEWNLEDTLLDKEQIENYCDENTLSEDEEEKNSAIAEQILSGNVRTTLKLSADQKAFFMAIIYPALLALLPLIWQSITAQPSIVNEITYNENYSVSVVNNYYTVEQNIDANILNDFHFMFVAKSEIKVRQCADNSSTVVGELSIGKVVQVVDKYKKWVQISWYEDEEYYIGWVQNWKLSEFK